MNAMDTPAPQSKAVPVTAERSAIPTATYRLQLHKGFTLGDAEGLVPYFNALGISHLYLSPVQVARAGSTHGYDVIDHRAINPELGGEAGLRQLSAACRSCAMGLIVDIVPNHMAVGGADNNMWLDVLENGANSTYANVFDIDFRGTDSASAGKVIVPVLGEPYGDALRDGKLTLLWDASLGKLAFAYGPHRFPLRSIDYAEVTNGVAAELADLKVWQEADALHGLLERQHFRLTWWNAAGDIINWRRFFDVNELAGLRMEDEPVFALTHAIILRLYGEGIIDGVRVDHVDGLADPAAYLDRLRRALEACTDERPSGAPKDGPYIVVEKILGSGEVLSENWGTQGTTGYDFMDQVSALQHKADGQDSLNRLWTGLSGRPEAFDSEETASRIEVLQGGFAGQLASCAATFADLAQADIDTRDLTTESFRRALVAFIARLRRYRSYATGDDHSPHPDPGYLRALAAAKEEYPADSGSLQFLETILAGGGGASQADRQTALRRLNQLTAPVAAKSVEDTAFYRYSRLLSRNDVGFDAGCLAMSQAEFLRSGEERSASRPLAMLTTATHDHKRGEDVRARLAVISEIPELWQENVRSWLSMTADTRPDIIAIDDAYAMLQTMVGAWPLGLTPTDTAGLKEFCERIRAWRQKSLREAKLRSSWAAPDTDYEAANEAWIDTLLVSPQSSPFRYAFTEFIGRVAPAGAVNSVVQAALRCTWPGIPDLYQGTELWDFSLVDPDNRRPVDYPFRQQLLQDACADWQSGAVKQSMIARLLQWRRSDPELFTSGDLLAMPVRGQRAQHVLAFRRQLGDRVANIAVTLHMADAVTVLGDMPSAGWWADTQVYFGEIWHDAVNLFHNHPVYAAATTAAVVGHASAPARSAAA